MNFVLLILFFINLFSFIFAEHHCGVGIISKFLSEFLSSPCNSSVLSERCCKPHDLCYDNSQQFYRIEKNEKIKKCDEDFKECILTKCYSTEQKYCRSWIYVSHGKLVEVVTTFCTWTGNILCDGY